MQINSLLQAAATAQYLLCGALACRLSMFLDWMASMNWQQKRYKVASTNPLESNEPPGSMLHLTGPFLSHCSSPLPFLYTLPNMLHLYFILLQHPDHASWYEQL